MSTRLLSPPRRSRKAAKAARLKFIKTLSRDLRSMRSTLHQLGLFLVDLALLLVLIDELIKFFRGGR